MKQINLYLRRREKFVSIISAWICARSSAWCPRTAENKIKKNFTKGLAMRQVMHKKVKILRGKRFKNNLNFSTLTLELFSTLSSSERLYI